MNKVILLLIGLGISAALFVGIMTLAGGGKQSREDILSTVLDHNQNILNKPSTVGEVEKAIIRSSEELEEAGEKTILEVPKISGEGSERILTACEAVWNTYVNKGLYYRSPPNMSIGADCSQYVYDVLKQAGLYNGAKLSSQGWHSAITGGSLPVGFQSLSTTPMDKQTALNNAKPGDIIVWYIKDDAHHVQIYAGDGKSWSWGGKKFTTVNGATVDPNFPGNLSSGPPTTSFKDKPCYIVRYIGDGNSSNNSNGDNSENNSGNSGGSGGYSGPDAEIAKAWDSSNISNTMGKWSTLDESTKSAARTHWNTEVSKGLPGNTGW